MNISKLQNISLWRFKPISGIIINNAIYFNASASSLYNTAHNDFTIPCANIVQDLNLNDQEPILLNNAISKQYGSRVQQNNCLYVSQSRTIFSAILRNGERKYKTYYGKQSYNSIRHFSSGNIDFTPEVKVPMQFNGIFKIVSESTPVKIAQDSLLWIHDCTGLPWWSVIVLTTIIARTTVTLPLALYQQYIIAKLANLKHEMNELVKELKNETNYGVDKYNWSKEYARHLYNHSLKKQWNKLIIRDNCHPAKIGLLVLVQIPLWISLSISIRNLCYMLPKRDINAYATYQEFVTDGFLWITNLTIADPFVLPIAMGLFNLAIIEITYMNRVKELTRLGKYFTYFFRIVTIGMIPIAMYVPSCVSLYWATSSACGLLQNLVLLSPKLRRFARVPVTASESPHPYLLLRERIIARCSFKKKVDISPKT